VRWIRNKYRRYDATRATRRKLTEITLGYPRIFRHWQWVTPPGDQDDKSPVTGDCHAGMYVPCLVMLRAVVSLPESSCTTRCRVVGCST
jgi:hypothetical protein